MKFTPESIRLARSAAAGISACLAAIGETDHPLEREQRVDELKNFITPVAGRSLLNIAHEVVAAEVVRTRQEFLDATRPFYFDAAIAGRAADECQAVTALNCRHSLLSESPSVEQAQLLLQVFTDFLASPAAAAVPDAEAISAGEESPQEGATATNQGNASEENAA